MNNRILKFRMWNPETKVMVDLYKITPLAVHPDLLKGNLDGLFIPFKENYPLMQFTGLLDKNGREIYEGDIVRVIDMPCSPDEHEWKGEVVFKHSCWEVVGREELLLYVFEYTNDNGYKPLLYEVIGNIYDNPELLNVPSEKGE